MDGWMHEWMHGWMYNWMDELISESMYKWTNDRASEWMSERLKEWMNGIGALERGSGDDPWEGKYNNLCIICLVHVQCKKVRSIHHSITEWTQIFFYATGQVKKSMMKIIIIEQRFLIYCVSTTSVMNGRQWCPRARVRWRSASRQMQ